MSAASSTAVSLYERPCPLPDEDGERIGRAAAAALAGAFCRHGFPELLSYAFRAHIGIERVAFPPHPETHPREDI